jgi:hypothetical protein
MMSLMLRGGERRTSAAAATLAAAIVLAAAAGAPAGARASSRAHRLPPAVARSARLPCRPRGSSTIAASSTARLFSTEDGLDYACLYSVNRAFYLSTAEHYAYELVHFAGPYVAFVQNVEAGDELIGLMDLRSGRLRTFAIATPIEDSVCYGVGGLVLQGDGAVAWIGTNFLASDCISPPGPAIEVRSHDRRGLHVLDSATTIATGSLRLSRGTLSWTHGGVRRTARLY